MLSRNMIMILSILALAISVSARPFANSTFVARQTLGAVNDLPVKELLPVVESLPVDDLPLSTLPLDNLPLETLPINVLPLSDSPVSVLPVTAPTQIGSSGNNGDGNQSVGNTGQNAGSDSSNSGTIGNDMSVGQAATTCGSSQLNCCNEISNSGDTSNAGVLGAIFGSGSIGINCTPISIPVVGAQIPLNRACDAKAACCQGDTTQNGLVNVGCVALTSLL